MESDIGPEGEDLITEISPPPPQVIKIRIPKACMIELRAK